MILWTQTANRSARSHLAQYTDSHSNSSPLHPSVFSPFLSSRQGDTPMNPLPHPSHDTLLLLVPQYQSGTAQIRVRSVGRKP